MPRKSEPAAPRPVGRPKSRPDGARPRIHWLTDAENEAVKALVKRLRSQRGSKPE